MNKCSKSGMTIYDSSKRRKAQNELVELKEEFEDLIDDLCQHCIEKEIKKSKHHDKMIEKSRKVIERIYEENERNV